MRGKRAQVLDRRVRCRLIPAHAGKTPRSSKAFGSTRAHPRACGENDTGWVVSSPEVGSSPRMRGKRTEEKAVILASRLIPAHAGKTPHGLSRQARSPAHPRACGENLRNPAHVRPVVGSSPRMRGKRGGSSAEVVRVGLIPAHAGKTFPFNKSYLEWEAHPRACGENIE